MTEHLKALSNDIFSLVNDKTLDSKVRLKQSYLYFELLFEILTSHANLNFSTLFTRIAYHSSTKICPPNYVRTAHLIRKLHDDQLINDSELELFADFILKYTQNQIKFELGESFDEITISEFILSKVSDNSYSKIDFRPIVQGLIIDIDFHEKKIKFLENSNVEEVFVLYNVLGHNDIHTKLIESIVEVCSYPIPTNLVDVDISDKGYLIPASFVVFPDYLIDVTTIASVHNESFVSPWLYLLNRFKARTTNPSIMIGNIANYFLERLIKDLELNFESLRQELFNLDPLVWATYDDDTVRNTLDKLKFHFNNIKTVIANEFQKNGIIQGKIYIEPSFYCKDFGIQGRLDMFHVNDNRTKAEIIELKSGKIFKPNAYGINHSHYSQTILYDLIIKSVYKGKLRSVNYLLYSQAEKDHLRLAPSSAKTISELIKVRNEIVMIEYAIALKPGLLSKVFKYLKGSNFPDVKGFISQDLAEFEGIYGSLSILEKKYFDHYIGFVAREHLLAKTGEHGMSKSNGLSALWLESIEEKIDRFSILNQLEILNNNSQETLPTITLQKSEFTASLANFRIGDIAILYPHSSNVRNILHHEIFKCNILAIEDTHITVRMRHAQINQHIFKKTKFWNLEEDVLDSAFRHMYRSLYEFTIAPKPKRDLLTGLKRPSFNNQQVDINLDNELTIHQKAIVRKIVKTEDYLLLWGPPGTGKTSKIIKHTAKALFESNPEIIVYLAYTNKAVDEICGALNEAGLGNNFIRIGSRFSVNESFHSNLLDQKIAECKSRNEIINTIKDCKIYVSTLASLLGRSEIFELINIDMAVIDEASQILEPGLVGLLTNFKRFVLIGDHKQLPAVVTQKPSASTFDNEILIENGFHDCRMSFFERLYLQCKQQGWNHVMESLDQQGRMHIDIMRFINSQFYEGILKTLPNLERLIAPNYLHSLSKKRLAENRMVYVPSDLEVKANYKVNTEEAKKVISLIHELIEIYQENSKSIHKESIGVITPYRAQIALIKSMLGADLQQFITIDTVERFQGGARDIIIFSACTNRQSQLESLVSLSQDGVDRKLNVAITRAKEQFILLGNKEILSKNDVYSTLINTCYHYEI
jgi:DNA replication ATP-dependent helicase Dna2